MKRKKTMKRTLMTMAIAVVMLCACTATAFAATGNLKTDIESVEYYTINIGEKVPLNNVIGSQVAHTGSCVKIYMKNTSSADTSIVSIYDGDEIIDKDTALAQIVGNKIGTTTITMVVSTSNCDVYHSQSASATITIKVVPTADQFIDAYLNGSDNMWTSITKDNASTIRAGAEYFSAMKPADQEAVNAALTAKAGTTLTYDTLSTAARIQDTKDQLAAEFANYKAADYYNNSTYPDWNTLKGIYDQAIRDADSATTEDAAKSLLSTAKTNLANVPTKAERIAAEKSKWQNDNATILAKTNSYLTNADKAAIDTAITQYGNLQAETKTELVNQYNELLKMKDAADWYNNNANIINKTSDITKADFEAAKAAINQYDSLSSEAKAKIDPDVVRNLNDKYVASKWYRDNDTIINKTPVTSADKDSIQAALDGYEDMTDAQKAMVDSDLIDTLKDKLNAAKWYDDNESVITKTAVTDDDIDDLTKAINAYDQLSADEKAQLDPTLITDLNDKLKAANWYKDNAAAIEKALVTGDDIESLQKAIDSYNELTDAEKSKLDPNLIANLNNKLNAANWHKDNEAILGKNPVTGDDLGDIKAAIDSYNELTDAEKATLDPDYIAGLNNKLNAANWHEDNKAILGKKPVSAKDLDDINAAIDSYYALTDEEKANLDDEYIKDLLAMQDAAEWLDKYGDLINKNPLSISDYDMLMEALDGYNGLSDLAKSYIAAIMPDTLDLDIEKVKKMIEDAKNAPKTGDDENMMLYLMLLALSAGGACALRKKEEL